MTGLAYLAPRTVEEALNALGTYAPEATVLAGGQDVVPLMNQGRLTPSRLIDISHLSPLAVIADSGVVSIGPLVSHADLARHPVVRRRVPLLAEAAAQIGGGIQVRNRGTLGGSACAANPAYDLPVGLVAAEAVFILRTRRETRRVPASSFFLGAGHTARQPDELLVGIEIPPPPTGSGAGYAKLKFTEGGVTIAAAACTVTLQEDGTCATARVAIGGVTEIPLRLADVEQALAGSLITDAVLPDAARRAQAGVVEPINDALAGGDYRRAMAGVMVRRALARAAVRARGGDGRK